MTHRRDNQPSTIKAEDLRRGDVLIQPRGQLIITSLIPNTSEETLTIGRRQVFSGTTSWTFDAGEDVHAIPRERRRVMDALGWAYTKLDSSTDGDLLAILHEAGEEHGCDAIEAFCQHLELPGESQAVRSLTRWRSRRSRPDVLIVLARASADWEHVRHAEAQYAAEMAQVEAQLRKLSRAHPSG